MRAALDLAVEAARTDGGPFGAVVVRAGAIVATGTNQVTATYDPTAHAEIVALRAAGHTLQTFHLHGCTLYTSCEPCPLCYAAALWARVDAVAYAASRNDAAAAGFGDVRFYEEIAKPAAERALPLVRVLGHDAHAPFAAWAANPHRTPY
ncbi:MAG: nucleoside deaminase [Actinomycetota bacterium]